MEHIDWTCTRSNGHSLDKIFPERVIANAAQQRPLLHGLVQEFQDLTGNMYTNTYLKGTLNRKLGNLKYYMLGPGKGRYCEYSKGMAKACRDLGIPKHPEALRCGRYATD